MDTTHHASGDPESFPPDDLETRIETVDTLDPVEAEARIADLVDALAELLDEPGGSD